MTSYDKIDELVRDDLVVGAILDDVAVCEVYSGILDDLRRVVGAIRQAEGDKAAQLVEFPYDWRRDLTQTAAALADRIDEIVRAAPDTRITLVAHSMGGLICRYMLESGKFADRDWFPNALERFIALAVPHGGAPLALDRALGLSGTMGMDAKQTKRLSANTKYPSAYQLIPGPGRAFMRDVSGGAAGSAIVDVHDKGNVTAKRLGLRLKNLARNRALHRKLDPAKRPKLPTRDDPQQTAPMDYVFFAGSGMTTANMLELRGNGAQTISDYGSGDKTVPVFSAAAADVPTRFVWGEHVAILQNYEMRKALFRLLGAPARTMPVAADGTAVAAQEVADISVPFEGVETGDRFELAVNFTSMREVVDDELIFEPLAALKREFSDMVRVDRAVRYEGPQIEGFVFAVEAPEAPGVYSVRFGSMESAQGRPPRLIVRQAAR